MSVYIHVRTGLLIIAEYDTDADDGGYWGWVPEMPGCASQGDSFGGFVANIGDAIDVCLEVMAEDGMPLPTENISVTGGV